MSYHSFIKSKVRVIESSGFEIAPEKLNKHLFPFQRECVSRALRAGRFALFQDCGLGKTIQQLEWAHQVEKHTKKPVLILAPLAVSAQTIEEGEKFGIGVCKYSQGAKEGILISNYEQLENIDPHVFSGIVLDESSCLKAFDGKTKTLILDMFRKTPYKLACTATPSPNDVLELTNHFEFLNAGKADEVMSEYFVHDGGETQKWRLKKHSAKRFWAHVASWAVCIAKPSDIGFSDDGYILPKLTFHNHEIDVDAKQDGWLLPEASVSATDFNQALRDTMEKRLQVAIDLCNKSKEQWIVWVNLNVESEYALSKIDGAVQVCGSEDQESKEEKLLGFAKGKYRVLITKKKIAQFGMNFQNCHNQCFATLDFSFEGLYQAIRRSYRFGQTKEVKIHIVTTSNMSNVMKAIENKQLEFTKMQTEMAQAVSHADKPKDDHEKQKDATGEGWRIINGDCVKEMSKLEPESVHLSIFSPPFADLYVYSDRIEDMGNSRDYDEFVKHFSYFCEQLSRVIKPGRNACIHCMDLPIQKGKEGYIGLRDFSGMIVDTMQKNGFIYHSRVTIWKNPVVEMQRTKALGLLHKQIKKDSSMSRVGIPDYVLVFRKRGENADPIRKNIDVDTWQKWASPVWMDIDYGDTLQYMSARDNNDERHICPLQLPTIERLIALWSNQGDTVLDPFNGIGSTGYKAVSMKRKYIGIELKKSYFIAASKNLKTAESENMQCEFDIV